MLRESKNSGRESRAKAPRKHMTENLRESGCESVHSSQYIIRLICLNVCNRKRESSRESGCAQNGVRESENVCGESTAKVNAKVVGPVEPHRIRVYDTADMDPSTPNLTIKNAD